MVKNSVGGNKSKRLGRKYLHEAAEAAERKCRLKDMDESDESYAVVSRLLGGDMCEVVDNKGRKMVCVIRKKFRGRNKRDNMLGAGTLILIGVRSWEASPKCDLLEVYTSLDMERIVESQPNELSGLMEQISSDLFGSENTYMVVEENMEEDIDVDLI